MFRDIEMHELTPAVGQHHEHEQKSKDRGGHCEESNAIKSGAWFFKNVRYAWDDGLRGRTMYFETLAWETVRPSFISLPWILGAPKRGLARLIRRIKSRSSVVILGRPRRWRLFHAQ
jgi:hypothetical protein